MKNVCVITGGGSGMGYSVAKLLPNEYYIIVVGRTGWKLDAAVGNLKAMGKEAEAFVCDVSDAKRVGELVERATSIGTVKMVLNAAGLSPSMGKGTEIFNVNAVGTINVNEAFASVMGEKSCILNVSSSSAYIIDPAACPVDSYALADEDIEGFKAAMLAAINDDSGLGYMITKHFVIWYSKTEALKYGKKGVRVLSVSPGTFLTPMGLLEGEAALGLGLASSLGRAGDPDEIGRLMVFLMSDEGSYMAGVDVLCDAGSIAALDRMQ